MRYRQLGPSGIEVSAVAFGTWAAGGSDWGRVDDGDTVKAVRRAMDLGVTLFDTAPLYGRGHAEEVLGRALGTERKSVVVATKCGPVEDERGLRVDLSAAAIRSQCEASLRRLGTDWVDLLQVHWNDAAFPVEETVRTIEDLVREGKARAIGVSNFGPADLRAAAGAGRIASLQPAYSLLRRGVEREVLPLCRELGIGVLAYEPLARGILTGKFDERTRFEPGDIRLRDDRFRGESFRAHVSMARSLARLAHRHGVTPAQLAVAWVVAQPGVTAAICGAKTAGQAVENARAADLEPDPDTLAEAASIASDLASFEPED